MTSVIYRDRSTNQRILVPVDDVRDGDVEAWDITCIEIWNGDYMRARELHVPGIILERHYKKEEL